MKFVVKYFPEITIKSKPVRKRLVSQQAARCVFALPFFDSVAYRRAFDRAERIDDVQYGRTQTHELIMRWQ